MLHLIGSSTAARLHVLRQPLLPQRSPELFRRACKARATGQGMLSFSEPPPHTVHTPQGPISATVPPQPSASSLQPGPCPASLDPAVAESVDRSDVRPPLAGPQTSGGSMNHSRTAHHQTADPTSADQPPFQRRESQSPRHHHRHPHAQGRRARAAPADRRRDAGTPPIRRLRGRRPLHLPRPGHRPVEGRLARDR